jgi:hypothetical protein
MNVACFFAQTHHPVAFQSCEKSQTEAIHQFPIVCRSILSIEKNALCLNTFVRDGIPEHVSKVIILCFAILIRRINAIIDWIEVLLSTSTVN